MLESIKEYFIDFLKEEITIFQKLEENED